MPARQFDVELGEISGSVRLFALPREPPEASREILRRTLLADRRPLQNAGDDRKDLARTRRLHEIVGHPPSDRVRHGLIFSRLGHHNDPDVWVLAAHDLQNLQAAPPRHLLVQQNEVVRVLTHQNEGVVPIRDRVHVVSTRLQKE